MPTVVIGENTGDDYSGVIDNQIDDNDWETNKDTDSTFAVGNSFMRWGCLIRFTGIPDLSGSTVSSTSINLYRSNGSGDTNTVTIYRVLRNYSQSQSCWHYYTGTTAWSTNGCLSDGNDKDADVSTSLSVNTTNAYKSFTGAQLTTDIQNIIDGVDSNYGFVAHNMTGSSGYQVFQSNEGTDGQRPYLSVTYESGGATVVPTDQYFRRMRAS